jgi:1,4-dihydroxy-2-naphthoyl-CoA hydrolase
MTTTQITVWHDTPTPDLAQAAAAGNLVGHLGIEFTDAGPDSLTARMPVDHRTRQPLGFLHGGASVALAETLVSFAATFTVDQERESCVGMEINANHLRSVSSGWVTGVATPVVLGRRTQVWEVRITDDDGALVCISRCTIAVVPRRS